MVNPRPILFLVLASMLGAGCFDPQQPLIAEGTTSDANATDDTGPDSSPESEGSANPDDDGDTDPSDPSDPTDSADSNPETSSTGPSTSGDAETDTTGTPTSTGDAESGSTGPQTDEPPEVTITTPAMDLTMGNSLFYSGFDDALGMWYTDVSLVGVATDLEDGDISEQIEWTTNQTTIQAESLGTGASLTARIYSNNCEGVLHVITADVVDSDDNAAPSVSRQIVIYTIC